MKKCVMCQQVKNFCEFNICRHKKDGHSSYCRPCDNARSKTYYKGYKIKRRQLNKQRVKNNQIKIIEYLRNHSCVDCGYNKSPAALSFDHVLGDKLHNVSKMVMDGYGWNKILREIDKCEVRCANCHLERTSQQFNWFSKSW